MHVAATEARAPFTIVKAKPTADRTAGFIFTERALQLLSTYRARA